MPDYDATMSRLRAAGQEHLLTFFERLDASGRAALLSRIDAIELERVPEWVERYVRDSPDFSPGGEIEPPPYYPRDAASSRRRWDRQRFRAAGEDLLRAGKVAAFTVAGGQGTRLGYDGPKGCYPGGAVSGKPLFRCLAEWIVAAQRRYGCVIPWYVMTSPLNHQPTIEFFEAEGWFGLDRADVMHFEQGVMPSFDMRTGKILLADPDAPATNPDGHGGSLKALHKSGAIEDMRRRGVEHISYVQVDNPLVRVIDPVFIGLHATAEDSSGEMSSKMLEKTEPGEKVGVFCVVDGRVRVIEYSDLPEALASKRRDDGGLMFNAGNPAIHMLGVEFVARLNESEAGFALPFHRAEKKVAHVDPETGERIDPEQPNGIKLETFVFDALPLAKRSIVLETDRVEEFAPIKNASGNDSAESSARLQTERAARWLERAGVRVPRGKSGEPDCTLEISPLFAMDAEDLTRGAAAERLRSAIEPGAEVCLD